MTVRTFIALTNFWENTLAERKFLLIRSFSSQLSSPFLWVCGGNRASWWPELVLKQSCPLLCSQEAKRVTGRGWGQNSFLLPSSPFFFPFGFAFFVRGFCELLWGELHNYEKCDPFSLSYYGRQELHFPWSSWKPTNGIKWILLRTFGDAEVFWGCRYCFTMSMCYS